jgi:hypothetical protein
MESHGNGITGLRRKFAVLSKVLGRLADVFNGTTRAAKFSRRNFERGI